MTMLNPPWRASLALGVCAGLVASPFLYTRAVLQTIYLSSIPGHSYYRSDFILFVCLVYLAIVRKIGIKRFKQYFFSGVLLALPSFLLMGTLSIVVDAVAVPALAFYAFAVWRGHGPIRAAVWGGLLGVAGASLLSVFLYANWVE
jgi:hypothetical protein